MSRASVSRAADAALRRSPAQALSRRRSAHRLAVLAYHGIDDPDCFAGQLDLLVRRATPVALADVDAALHGGPRLPERAVLLTFDDGEPSLLHEGLPLLRERGVPGVAYVLPGLLGTQQPFWWVEADRLHAAGARVGDGPADADGSAGLVRWLKTVPDTRRREVLEELRAQRPDADVTSAQLGRDELSVLREGGVEVGNHTWTHPCLDRCSEEEVRHQVLAAHEALGDVLGAPPTSFAYPNGNHDPRAEALLGELGYRTGFLFDHRLSPPPHQVGEPLRVSRLRVGSTTTLDRFATILSGLHPALHHARGRD